MSLLSGILPFLLLSGQEVPKSPLLPAPLTAKRRHTAITEAIVDGLRGECFDLHRTQALGNAALDSLPRMLGSSEAVSGAASADFSPKFGGNATEALPATGFGGRPWIPPPLNPHPSRLTCLTREWFPKKA